MGTNVLAKKNANDETKKKGIVNSEKAVCDRGRAGCGAGSMEHYRITFELAFMSSALLIIADMRDGAFERIYRNGPGFCNY